MRVEEVVGQQMRTARERLEITQEQLGHRLGELLGRDWSRQAVSAAERGARAFTAAELVAVAHALSTNIGWLVAPPPIVASVELPSGVELPRSAVIEAALSVTSTERAFAEIQQALLRQAQHLGKVAEGATAAMDNLQLLSDQILSLPLGEQIPDDVANKARELLGKAPRP